MLTPNSIYLSNFMGDQYYCIASRSYKDVSYFTGMTFDLHVRERE